MKKYIHQKKFTFELDEDSCMDRMLLLSEGNDGRQICFSGRSASYNECEVGEWMEEALNALTGRDPAALDGLLEAVKAFISDGGPDGTGWREIGKHVDAMAAALAAFQGGGE